MGIQLRPGVSPVKVGCIFGGGLWHFVEIAAALSKVNFVENAVLEWPVRSRHR
jgi:hypothetical protein